MGEEGNPQQLIPVRSIGKIGAKTCGLLKNIVAPNKPADLTYAQIIEHLPQAIRYCGTFQILQT